MHRASKNVFFNFFSDRKSIDAGKQLRYAEHYYEYSHEKLGRKNENSSYGYNINGTVRYGTSFTKVRENHCIKNLNYYKLIIFNFILRINEVLIY